MKGLALALALGAPAEPYRAQGSDPAWSLTMEAGRITYVTRGSRPVGLEIPAPIEDEGIVYYRAPGFQLTVMRLACTDEASGRRYSDSVFLTAGKTDLVGCGGTLLPEGSLDGTSWYFAEIGGEATGLTGDIFKDDRYAIDFGSDSFVGYTGCNRIGGRYAIADGVMRVAEFGSTGNGCGDPAGRRERLAWRILSGEMRISRPSPEIMQLTGAAGTIRLRRGED